MSFFGRLPSRPLDAVLFHLPESDRVNLSRVCKGTGVLKVRDRELLTRAYTSEIGQVVNLVESHLKVIQEGSGENASKSRALQLRSLETSLALLKSQPLNPRFVHSLVMRALCTLYRLDSSSALFRGIDQREYLLLHASILQAKKECTFEQSLTVPTKRRQMCDAAYRGETREAAMMALDTKCETVKNWHFHCLCLSLLGKNQFKELIDVCGHIFADKRVDSESQKKLFLKVYSQLNLVLTTHGVNPARVDEMSKWILQLFYKTQSSKEATQVLDDFATACVSRQAVPTLVAHMCQIAKEGDASWMLQIIARVLWFYEKHNEALQLAVLIKDEERLISFLDSAIVLSTGPEFLNLLKNNSFPPQLRDIGYLQLIKHLLQVDKPLHKAYDVKKPAIQMASECVGIIQHPSMKSHAHYLIADHLSDVYVAKDVLAKEHLEHILEDYEQMHIINNMTFIAVRKREYDTAFAYAMMLRDTPPASPKPAFWRFRPAPRPDIRSVAILRAISWGKEYGDNFSVAAQLLRDIPDLETREVAAQELIDSNAEGLAAAFHRFTVKAFKIHTVNDQALVDILIRALVEEYARRVPREVLEAEANKISDGRVHAETMRIIDDAKEASVLDAPLYAHDDTPEAQKNKKIDDGELLQDPYSDREWGRESGSDFKLPDSGGY